MTTLHITTVYSDRRGSGAHEVRFTIVHRYLTDLLLTVAEVITEAGI